MKGSLYSATRTPSVLPCGETKDGCSAWVMAGIVYKH